MLAKPNAYAHYSGASFTGLLYNTANDVDSILAMVKDEPNVFMVSKTSIMAGVTLL